MKKIFDMMINHLKSIVYFKSTLKSSAIIVVFSSSRKTRRATCPGGGACITGSPCPRIAVIALQSCAQALNPARIEPRPHRVLPASIDSRPHSVVPPASDSDAGFLLENKRIQVGTSRRVRVGRSFDS